MKVTTIGTALVDIYFSSHDFMLKKNQGTVYLCQAYGHKIEIDEHHLTTGGAASNCAVAFALRGHEVSIIAELGQDDFATIIQDELRAHHIDTSHLIVEPQESTGCSVILRGSDGGRTIMVSRSASAMLDDYDIDLDYLASRDWLYLSSLGGSLNALAEIWQVFSLNAQLGFTWNPGKNELAALIGGKLPLPPVKAESIFVVNESEWQQVKALKEQILATFKYVVVTAGRQTGQVFVAGEFAEQIAPSNKPAFEETGAGDAFGSAFSSTIMYGRSLKEAIEAGINNAQSVIDYIGAKKGLLAF